MEFVRITDSIKFAREIEQDLESRGVPSEEDIQLAVGQMNKQLYTMNQDNRVILKAAEVFTIPTDEMDIELLSDAEILESRVENPFLRARLRSFIWLGSVGLTGFGANLYEVDFIEPQRHHTESAFMPLASAGPRIDQQYRY